jgi:hypothetical protein
MSTAAERRNEILRILGEFGSAGGTAAEVARVLNSRGHKASNTLVSRDLSGFHDGSVDWSQEMLGLPKRYFLKGQAPVSPEDLALELKRVAQERDALLAEIQRLRSRPVAPPPRKTITDAEKRTLINVVRVVEALKGDFGTPDRPRAVRIKATTLRDLTTALARVTDD